jgi:hypothetical protein
MDGGPMSEEHMRLVMTPEWVSFSSKIDPDSPIWPLLDHVDECDVEDLLELLKTSGVVQVRVAAMILLGSLFLALDAPVEDNYWRDMLIVELKAIVGDGTAEQNLKFMAQNNLTNAKMQEAAQKSKAPRQ